MLAITLFLTLFALLLFSVPIGICLGLATMIVMIFVDGTPPMVLLARSVVTGADSFPLLQFHYLYWQVTSCNTVECRVVWLALPMH